MTSEKAKDFFKHLDSLNITAVEMGRDLHGGCMYFTIETLYQAFKARLKYEIDNENATVYQIREK